ncbi:MAG: glycosyltransferase family 39 protein [Calothrix sp. C42_A2020_038]|nr:glycosyltransferase family 39 protein [Calothrix sp. C42_A2020_038]
MFPNVLILLVIWGLGAICDRIWLSLDNSIPGWDQADYLTGTLNYWRALQNIQFDSKEWWQSFWLLSSKIPPLIYIIAGLIQSVFGTGQDQAMLVMLLFSGILLFSVYGLGKVLFNATVGLWAAALCQFLPGLYQLRLQFLLDYPLAAIVTLCFFFLTILVVHQESKPTKLTISSRILRLCLVTLFGISLGLALLVKQTALFFLLVPIIWVGIGALRARHWGKLVELFGGIWISSLIFGGWYQTNWLIILTSAKRATIDSAIAEGDPPLDTLEAWIFYWQQLPYQVSLPLLLIPILSLLIYWGKFGGEVSKAEIKKEGYSLRWLAIFLIGAYLLTTLNVNKDDRYAIPYLPTLSVLLAYGLTRGKGILGQRIRWGTCGLALLLALCNLFPIGNFASDWITQVLSPNGRYRPGLQASLPHREVIAEIIRTEPYLRSTLGVLPSTSQINQHNLNYYGALAKFQVYGRQVGTRKKHIEKDARTLSWFVTKTGEQGSVPSSQKDIVQTVETSSNFDMHSNWRLNDGSFLRLYHKKTPPIEIISRPLEYSSVDVYQEKNIAPVPVTLKQVNVPKTVPPGFPVPVTYKWSGSWDELKNGLVLLTWHQQNNFNQNSNFLHDHAIGMGNLHTILKTEGTFQVIERTAMLPPAQITPGNYTLEANYLNRVSGETYPIHVSDITINIDPQAQSIKAPELDLVTQLRTMSSNLPKGTKAIEEIFDEVARINQYDPTQDYLSQARLAAQYRLKYIGNNSDLAYSIALTDVLQRRVKDAISSLEKVTQLDAQNPFAWAYLAFVHLYNWQPVNAEIALKPALEMSPNQREFKALSGIAALMRGNIIKAWQELNELRVNN